MTRSSLVAAIAIGLVASCGGTKAEPVPVLDPAVEHYGKTYGEWAAAWVKWVYEWPVTTDCADPIGDPTGELCNLYQDGTGPVFFLTGNWGGVSRRNKCTVPAGKALFVPIIVGWEDNGGVPAANVKTDAQLKQSAETQADAISGLGFSVDDQPLQPLAPYEIRSAPYEYTLPAEPNIYTCQGSPGVTGSYNGYTSGYFVLLEPLSSGPHQIAMKAEKDVQGDAPFKLDVSYDPILVP